MGRLVKVLVLTILISSLGMINLPPATADGIVDQENVAGITAVFAEIGTAPPVIGQTFTPTVPDIVAVDIFLRGGDSTVLLDIFIANNVPNSVTFRADFNPGCPCDITVPIHVDFTGVLANSLTVGSTNIITIQHSAGSSDTLTEWAGSAANAYAPGSAQGPGSSAAINDFFFRTYEGPSVAVGSISIPIDSTPMLVAGSEMNSVWITIAIAAAIGVGILIIRRNYFSAE